MILAVLLDLMNYERYQLGWAYYLFCCRCKENGWRFIAQERYVQWEPKLPREWEEINGGAGSWDYRVLSKYDMDKVKKYVIPEKIFEDLRKETGSWLEESLWLQTKRYTPLEEYLERYIEEAEQDAGEPVEAIVTYLQVATSISYIAEKRGLQTLTFEAGSLRSPGYRGTAYLCKKNTHWKPKGEMESRYLAFCADPPEIELFNNKELLAIFLLQCYLRYLRLYDSEPVWNMLVVGGFTIDPICLSNTKYGMWEMLDEIRQIYGDSFIFRPNPHDRYKATMGIPEEHLDYSYPNIMSILKSRHIATISSNMLMDVVLWGRTPCCKVKNFELSFMCQSDYSAGNKQEIPKSFLNFLFLCFHVPMELALSDEYIRWRITKPTEKEIFYYHLRHYLFSYAIDESFLDKSTEQRLSEILSARGETPELAEPLRREAGETLQEYWKRAEEYVGFVCEPTLNEQLTQVKNLLAETEGCLDETKGCLAETEGRLTDTEKRLADTEGRLTVIEECRTEAEERLTEAKRILAKTEEQLNEAITSGDKTERQLQATQETLNTIQASEFWRVTYPLRKMLDIIKRICK
jgi:hypothetical protein